MINMPLFPQWVKAIPYTSSQRIALKTNFQSQENIKIDSIKNDYLN